ncbi:MAG: hypothetical protein JWO59_1673, partial [Chloroflexi bacterium]|nr:hypothetical protein [Chloroflexota bacterium]
MEAQLELSGAHLRAEDLHRIAVLDDVAISPDGRLVAATVRTADIDANLYRSAISIFPVDGSTSWPLTAGTTKDWAPSWSPSGTRLAFLSDRGGSTQVWVIGIHGEARQLTTFPDGVSERPVWSPDGRHLAVVSWQQNDAVSGDDAMASDADASIAVITRTCYRIDGQGYVGNRRHHIWIVDSETGLTRQVTDGETDNYEPAWSPTGDRIVFVSNRVDDQIIDF